MPYRRLFLSDAPFPDTVAFEVPKSMPDVREVDRFFAEQPEIAAWAGLFMHPDIENPEAFLEEHRQWIGEQAHEHPGALGAVGPDGVLHWGKIVPCRVDDEALVSWMADSREGNREFGSRPDRPPDIDTPTTRSWVRHPGEPDERDTYPEQAGIIESFPVFVAVHQISVPGISASGVIKLLFTWNKRLSGNIYEARVKAERDDGKVMFDASREIPEATEGDWLAEFLAVTEERLAPLLDFEDHPVVTTYADFEHSETEMDDVQRDIAAYYGVPENWQKLERAAHEEQVQAEKLNKAGTAMLEAMWRKKLVD